MPSIATDPLKYVLWPLERKTELPVAYACVFAALPCPVQQNTPGGLKAHALTLQHNVADKLVCC